MSIVQLKYHLQKRKQVNLNQLPLAVPWNLPLAEGGLYIQEIKALASYAW
jgi:hypothetical protein